MYHIGLTERHSPSLLNAFPHSNVQEQVWTWMSEGNEYFYDKHEWVRVRIEEEHWNDLSPIAPSDRDAETAEERKSPYSLIVKYPSLSS